MTTEDHTFKPDVFTASDGYASRFAGPVGEFLLQTQARIVTQLLGNLSRPLSTVLEIGGGHAQLTGLFLARGLEVTVQGSEPSCHERVRRLQSSGLSIHESVCDLTTALPFAASSFDLVAAIRLVPHVQDYEKLIGELCRIASMAVLIDYAPLMGFNLLSPILFQVKKRIEGNTRPFFTHTDSAIRRAFDDNGFGAVTITRECFVPLGIHRALNKPAISESAEALCRRIGLTRALGSPALALAVRRGERA